jgi:hypothetical protein
MPEPIFCEHHTYATGDSENAYACSPDNPEARLFCTAHLCEGHAFPCPYKPKLIFLENGHLRIAHIENNKRVGFCEDFEPPRVRVSEAKTSDLAAKVSS